MECNFILEKRQGLFVNETLCFFGILLQNNKTNNIVESNTNQIPFLKIKEGYITTPEIYNKVRNLSNVTVYKSNIKIIEKRYDTKSKNIEITHDSHVFDLYNPDDLEKIKNLILNWETDKKIYLQNTEPLPTITTDINTIVGVSSGNGLAQLAYYINPKKVIFFDYNYKALEFQQKLLKSKDRKQVYLDYIEHLTLGRPIHINTKEINKLDFSFINKIYDKLSKIETVFIKADFRTDEEINDFFKNIDYNSHVWLSNILHYSTHLFYFDTRKYKIVDYWQKTKNLTIYPHTRIHYESKDYS